MKISSIRKQARAAFSMIDVLVSMGIIGTSVMALYAGISMGYSITEGARENLRATQIILEKFETIRLYNWDQINSNGFIPTNFTAAYAFNHTNSGFLFRGTVTVTNAPGTNSYSSDMKMVTVNVKWTSGGKSDGVARTRQLSTMVSRFGLQNYVY
jgi:Tfp pilus assembly protein PilV